MPAVAEIQSRLRHAVVARETGGVESLLAGGELGRHRLEIHCRHYETSLGNALVEKFPGCVWLVGEDFVTQAARIFIRLHPPEAPCIAEYGAEFPQFLASAPGAGNVLYLREFAELEWLVGQVAIAVDLAAIPLEELSAVPADLLPDLELTVQPGIRYLQAGWPIDELMKLYLAETAPESLVFEPTTVWLEIRGARGEFSVTRLDSGEFLFRQSIWRGQSIGEAAECGLKGDSDFDPGRALAAVIAGRLVTAIRYGGQE